MHTAALAAEYCNVPPPFLSLLYFLSSIVMTKRGDSQTHLPSWRGVSCRVFSPDDLIMMTVSFLSF